MKSHVICTYSVALKVLSIASHLESKQVQMFPIYVLDHFQWIIPSVFVNFNLVMLFQSQLFNVKFLNVSFKCMNHFHNMCNHMPFADSLKILLHSELSP